MRNATRKKTSLAVLRAKSISTRVAGLRGHDVNDSPSRLSRRERLAIGQIFGSPARPRQRARLRAPQLNPSVSRDRVIYGNRGRDFSRVDSSSPVFAGVRGENLLLEEKISLGWERGG